MSMSSSFVYGYGFNCDCGDEKLVEFLKVHKQTFCQTYNEEIYYKEFLKCVEEKYDLDAFFEEYQCEENGTEGKGAIIANIMTRETGIRFIYCLSDDNCDTPASVVFETCYPWQLNDKEKNLTQDVLGKICQTYMDELGISGKSDFLELEYYG